MITEFTNISEPLVLDLHVVRQVDGGGCHIFTLRTGIYMFPMKITFPPTLETVSTSSLVCLSKFSSF